MRFCKKGSKRQKHAGKEHLEEENGEVTQDVFRQFCMEERQRILGNRSLLIGQQIWLHNDLTPTQVEAQKEELLKVCEAMADGWIAYMREGVAVITNRWREEK
ncbi:hypothetical protein R1sor_012814 [Riccia sorocarpa]|uniref:Uncharacterized protein n=1 Tax=Riccia sorocarpa TaxID=122646 RepID=A0ABD3I572_9MARC